MGDVIKFRPRTSFAAPTSNRANAPGGVRLTEVEDQFFEIFWKVLQESGQEAPPDLHLPRGTRVVHRALVSRAYRQSFLPVNGAQPISENTLKSRWRRSTSRLIKFGVIAYSDPHLWHTGVEVVGKPATQHHHRPGGAA